MPREAADRVAVGGGSSNHVTGFCPPQRGSCTGERERERGRGRGRESCGHALHERRAGQRHWPLDVTDPIIASSNSFMLVNTLNE